MRNITATIIIAAVIIISAGNASGQLYINGGGFTIDSGAVVNVKGDLTGTRSISGTGKLVMNGTVGQNMSMNGNTVPSLEINNAQNITMNSAARVQAALVFVNGRIIAGNNNLTLSSSASASGMGAGKFIETNGTGQVFKELSANVTSFEMPVGVGTVYRPVFISTAATYASAGIGVRALAASNPGRPSFSTDYLNVYWPITRTGITGTVTAIGQYADPTDISGTESKLRGCFYDGAQWSNSGSSYDAALNRVGATVATAGGSLYGMSPFAMLGVKAFLQGSYTSNAMNNYLYSQGLHADVTAVDSLYVNLWSPSALAAANPGYSYKTLLHTDGNSNIMLLPEAALGNTYYIALRHRSSIETWSASPVTMSSSVSYDFTTAASKAYGGNQANLGGGKYALFSGDLNQDGMIETEDYTIMENDVLNILFGYQVSDLTEDGMVETSDYTLMENNVLGIIFMARP